MKTRTITADAPAVGDRPSNSHLPKQEAAIAAGKASFKEFHRTNSGGKRKGSVFVSLSVAGKLATVALANGADTPKGKDGFKLLVQRGIAVIADSGPALDGAADIDSAFQGAPAALKREGKKLAKALYTL